MAECHPVGFRFVMEAKRRGATVIHVDPRFTRTSALADLYVPLRAGTDIAFLGGLIHHVLERELYFREYVTDFTNASFLVREDFRDTDELDGLFSGWDRERAHYEVATWQYEGASSVPASGHKETFAQQHDDRSAPHGADLHSVPRDPTLQHPRCVLQVLRRHFARYTPETVAKICGVPPELFLEVADALCRNSGRERTSAFCYSVGWTQHTKGVQYIRAASILQLLLGNIGRPGGGIMALRGHASIQGSTDIPTLFDLLPGYLRMPRVGRAKSLEQYLHTVSSAAGWWGESPKYMVSLLKAWFGAHATRENDWGFAMLPRLTGDHSHMQTVADMADGKVPGYFVIGENPAVGSVNGALQRKGLRNAKWVVVRDLALTESAEFWRTAPEVQSGAVKPEEIDTEVFFFPAAAHTEKDGTFTNTQRLLQWREKAVEPLGDARSELHFVFHLGRRLKAMYRDSREERDRALQALTWDYPTEGSREDPSAEAVLKEINGYTVADCKPVSSFTELKDDGTTACGCWIYSGCFRDGVNQTARRKPAGEQGHVAQEWAWAWPDNRRLLYNRASADADGKPWSERKKYVWWDAAQKIWTGLDTPDFLVDRPPSYRPPKSARGKDTIAGNDPFLMQADGKGWLFAPSGLLDGPMPTHYEPQESPVANALYGQQCNPARSEWRRRDNPYALAHHDGRFPFVLTTFRLTEHHTAGAMSRTLSWLSELQPELFCEVSPELAKLRGLENGGWATVRTPRGELECRVLVTPRLRPLRLGNGSGNGTLTHQLALPYHWGYTGRVTGGIVNDLFGFVSEPNVHIMESKATVADIVAGRCAEPLRAADGYRSRAPRPLPQGLRNADEAGPRRDLQGIEQPSHQPTQTPGSAEE